METISIFIICSIILYIVLFFYTWYLIRKRIYVHTSLNRNLMAKYPLKHKEVQLQTNDGEKISAWYSPVKEPKAVIILIHGFTDKNGGKALMLPHADYLSKAGYSIMLLDLRSAGESSGNKVYLGIKEWQEAEKAYDYLKAQPENKNKKIGLFGISMGGSTAIIAAGKTQKGDFIIASVPYASYDKQFELEIQKMHFPKIIFFPVLKLVAGIEFGKNYSWYDPEKQIVKIRKPILIFSGKYDSDVDYHQGEYLYSLANNPKQFWLANTEHDIFDQNPAEFKKRVLTFLDKFSNQ